MKKTSFALIAGLLGILLLTQGIPATHPADAILNDAHTIKLELAEPLVLVGKNCYSQGDFPSELERTINVSEAREYELYAKTLRGNPNQAQIKEEYFVEVGTQKGPVAQDDSDPFAITTRVDFLGKFNLQKGNNALVIKSAAQCPPDKTANSVRIGAFYILPLNIPADTPTDDTPDTPTDDTPTDDDEEKPMDRDNDNGKFLDCPVEYFDPLPKFYNCPIDEFPQYQKKVSPANFEIREKKDVQSTYSIDEEQGRIVLQPSYYARLQQEGWENPLLLSLVILTFLLLILLVLLAFIKRY